MELVVDTLLTSHAPRAWLKAEAPLNMDLVVETWLMSHASRAWLKTVLVEQYV